MSELEKFTVFCIESYKNAAGLSGEQALNDFEEYDVFSYIAGGFTLLSQQEPPCLMAYIQDYIHRKQ
jgi:hypothetical protein